MRFPQKKPSTMEAAFKTEKKKEEEEEICSCSDEEEAQFVKKLDRGLGKYKGKLPFKFFNCGRVGHYAAKCPHKKVKTAKLQVYRAQFENLKMNDDEDIDSFFLKVAEIVNNMKALGETMPESIIVQKILRSLPSRFNPKVSAIEETSDWETLTMN